MFKIIEKEEIFDYGSKKLAPLWIYRDVKQTYKDNNYFKSTKLTNGVWLSGKDGLFLKAIIDAIENAKEMICLSSYIFSEPEIKEALLKASNKGIRVYMITASNKHLSTLPEENDDFNSKMYEEMRILFRDMQGKVKIRTSGNFHTKFILIDPRSKSNSSGFLLTSNLDTKGLKGRVIRKVFKVNPEIGIALNKTEIQEFFDQFCYGFWELSTEDSKKEGFFPIT